MKKHFFAKLTPPRSTFAQDMTAEERGYMMQHQAYWQEHIDNGTAIAIGLVLDPHGAYGVGVISVENEDILKGIVDNDPALKTGSRYEILPMMANFKKN